MVCQALQQAHEQIGTLLSQQSDAYKALQAQLGRQSQAEARAHDAIAERVHPSRTYADGCGRYLRLCCGDPPANTMQQNNPPHRTAVGSGRRQWPTYTTALCAHSASSMHGLSQCHRSLTLGRCCAHCKQRCRRFKRGRVPPPATRRVHASEWRWLRAKLDTAGPIPLEWGA